jgi:hypothetical protein
LSPRQVDLRTFANSNGMAFYPQQVRNAAKFRDFPIATGHTILFEENILAQYTAYGKIEISDVTISDGARHAGTESQVTVAHISDLDFAIPDFALEPERLWTRISELSFGNDIDFEQYPIFSSKFYLRGYDEQGIRKFFNEEMVLFLETHDGLHVEAHKNKLVIYLQRDLTNASEIREMLDFAEAFISVVMKLEKQPA